MKKILIILLISALILPMSFAAQREDLIYLGIGDSIAYGMSADPLTTPESSLNGYFTQYKNYLDTYYETTGINFGMAGLTSGQMKGHLDYFCNLFLAKDDTNYKLNTITSANVITISIGGNDLLGVLVEKIGETSYTNQNEYNLLLQQLSNDPSFEADLRDAANQFGDNWESIITSIRLMNPEAEIFVLKLYNPIDKEENEYLHDLIEDLTKTMNKSLMKHQNKYKLLKVDKVFDKCSEAENFDIRYDSIITSPLALDPHPSQIGHDLIFNELVHVRNPRSFK